MDECNENNSGCVQNCVNTIGSYYCSCRSGFDLNPDKKTCQGKINVVSCIGRVEIKVEIS